MKIITGAAGFISSALVGKLNREGISDLVLVDDFSREDKRPNWAEKDFVETVDRNAFFQWIHGKENQIDFIIHLGARTDTTEKSVAIFDELNLSYSQKIWNICAEHEIPLIYASSAATYGGGEHGFSDDESIIPQYKPLNPYGDSKQQFDVWALAQDKKPPFWAGLKFFNVYGPNEYHKGRMASVIFHAFHQIRKTGGMKLFRSHREDYKNGEQSRDFVYVMDVVEVIRFLMQKTAKSGIYNLGSGQARSFNDLTRAVFKALEMPENISYIDTPEDIRDTYQYFTEAKMEKLRENGFQKTFHTLEAGVENYVKEYLLKEKIF